MSNFIYDKPPYVSQVKVTLTSVVSTVINKIILLNVPVAVAEFPELEVESEVLLQLLS